MDINYRLLIKFTLKKCDYIIIESSSQGIDQGRIEGINFTYAIITNISKAHLGNFNSFKDYIETKNDIFEHVNKEGEIFINGDDKFRRCLLFIIFSPYY